MAGKRQKHDNGDAKYNPLAGAPHLHMMAATAQVASSPHARQAPSPPKLGPALLVAPAGTGCLAACRRRLAFWWRRRGPHKGVELLLHLAVQLLQVVLRLALQKERRKGRKKGRNMRYVLVLYKAPQRRCRQTSDPGRESVPPCRVACSWPRSAQPLAVSSTGRRQL